MLDTNSVLMSMATLERHSSIAHAAYHDLIRSLREEAVSGIRGTPTAINRGERTYWYDSYRVGNAVKKTYIGEDSAELRGRLGALSEIKQEQRASQQKRMRLIRHLRAEGFLGVDAGTGSLLASLAKAGVFRLGGTIVGTFAFRLFEGELGVRYGFEESAVTDDLDLASFQKLSLALDDVVSEPLQDVLQAFDFEALPSLEPGRTWRWKQSGRGLLVEFLTPSFDAEEGLKPLPALGVDAQSLHYLNYLIAEPITAAITYRDGALVQIPRPERYAIHKLIVADRRAGRDRIKALKDVRQAELLIRILAEDRPYDLAEAYQTARDAGPAWRERLDRTLARYPAIAGLLTGLDA
ncbi:GSU2403 family nucleotidyltransferase fold protein [Xanthobacteraceae bacterium A53D]